MNPFFLGESRPTDTPRFLVGQLASLRMERRGRARVTLDAIPIPWIDQHWIQSDGRLPDAEEASRFLEEAPFFQFNAHLGRRETRRLFRLLDSSWEPDAAPPEGVLGEWLVFTFDTPARRNAVCYSSASDSGTRGFLTLINPAPANLILYLNAFTPSVTKVLPSDPQLHAVIGNIPPPYAMAVLDVGQGSSNVMLSENGRPLFYFDAGRGTGGNWGTTPAGLEFCTCGPDGNPVPVFLSHWHSDHFLGTASDPDLLKCTWITPPAVTTKQMAYQNGLLFGGAKVLELQNNPPFILQFGTPGSYTLVACTGSPNDPNESGHALMVEWQDRRWLLPADASYKNISLASDQDFTAVVATHHGGKFTGPFVPDRASGYARLVYSFGPNNSHGHPSALSVFDHAAQWSHGNWNVAPPPGYVPPGWDVRATAVHGIVPNHSGGVAVGWLAPPPIPGLAAPCPTCAKSLNIQQN